MDMKTGIIRDFDDKAKLALALEENPNLVRISREERRKLARYDAPNRPAKLVEIRATAAARNKAKAARKARRIQRRK
jgi:hypothetical protein